MYRSCTLVILFFLSNHALADELLCESEVSSSFFAEQQEVTTTELEPNLFLVNISMPKHLLDLKLTSAKLWHYEDEDKFVIAPLWAPLAIRELDAETAGTWLTLSRSFSGHYKVVAQYDPVVPDPNKCTQEFYVEIEYTKRP